MPSDPGTVANEAVSFETVDGVPLKGHLYANAGPKRTAVILAHDGTNNQGAWRDFAGTLAARGVAALTFDFRGFGESAGTRDAQKVDLDLEIAYRFMRSREYTSIYVIGSTLGATATLQVAVRQELAGIALISPGGSQNLDIGALLPRITEPKLFVGSSGDTKATAEIPAFMDKSPAPKEQLLVAGTATGLDILRGPAADEVRQRLLDFVSR